MNMSGYSLGTIATTQVKLSRERFTEIFLGGENAECFD
jgi:hypothetical protein